MTTSPTDGSVSPGSDPPPTADVIDAISTPVADGVGQGREDAGGRTSSSSGVAASIRQTGIRVVASPAR